MKKNKLDSIIKEKLSEQHMSIDKMDWLAMNERLNQEFGPDNTIEENRDFDQSIRQKLKNDEAQFQEAHWQMLIDRLEEEEDKRIRVFIIRILKYTAILLLLLSLWNWQGNSYLNKTKKNDSVKMATNLGELKSSQIVADISSIESIESTTDLSQNFVQASSDRVIKSTILRKESYDNPKSRIIVHEGTQHSAFLKESQSTLVINQQQDQDVVIKDDKGILFDSKSSTSTFVAIDGMEMIPQLATLHAQISLVDKTQLNIGLPMINIYPKEKEKTRVALNAIFGRDLYLIRSPEDPIYPLPSYFTDSKGLSGGLTVSLERNNLEFETGFIYSNVTYAPREVTEQYSQRGGFFETSLENISFNVLSIPINFKYHIDAGGKGSFFTAFGASFNGIVNSNFDTYDKFIAPQLTPVPGSFDDKSLLSQKDFEPGLLDGGSIFDNTFFTLDLGVGYRYQYGDHVAAYIQPTLQTQFTDGLGPNEDSLHKLSLNAGVKYFFN